MVRPEDIGTKLIQDTARAMALGDENEFLSAFIVPHRVETGFGTNVIETYAEMSQTFGRLRAHWRDLRVDQLDRACLAAMYIDDTTVVIVQRSRVLRAGVEVQPSYKSLFTAKLHDGKWRATNASYAVRGSRTFSDVILGPNNPGRALSQHIVKTH